MGEQRAGMAPDERISANVRALREQGGISQAELARRMVERGHPWHQSTVTRVEQGTQQLRAAELVDLAAIFKTSLDRFTWTQPEASAVGYIYSAGTRVVRSADDVAKAVHRLLADIAAAERTLAMTEDTPYPRAQEARRDTAIRVETYTLDAAVDEGIRSYEERSGEKEGDDAAQGES
jgi:transcriptional regulator with XRE-family HTH domain